MACRERVCLGGFVGVTPDYSEKYEGEDFRFVSFSAGSAEERTFRAAYAPRNVTLRIRDMHEEERPRERLFAYGAKALSTAELLSILLGSGHPTIGLSAIQLGQHLLQSLSGEERDPLTRLHTVSAEDLLAIPGIGRAKAAVILAAIELGKRLVQRRPPEGSIIDDPAVAAAYFSHDLMWQAQEKFALLCLDVKHRVLAKHVLTVGTPTETLAHPRDIFREALLRRAVRVIVAHNHPSGVLEPSPEDIHLTQQLLKGGNVLGVPVLDHLILGNGDYVSLRQVTSLWSELPQDDIGRNIL